MYASRWAPKAEEKDSTESTPPPAPTAQQTEPPAPSEPKAVDPPPPAETYAPQPVCTHQLNSSTIRCYPIALSTHH